MSEVLQISGKNLGELALSDFCPRCFWIKLKHKLPFQIFPGIFSSIDAYTKKIVHGLFDQGKSPSWLRDLGNLVGYKDPPGWRDFQMLVREHNLLLTGAPDAIFVREDGSHLIADYKTARYTEAQDELLPMYEVQLNAYALIGEQQGFKPISALGLIYMEPMTDHGSAQVRDNHRDDGFAMGFSAKIHSVQLEPGRVWKALARARELFDTPTIPKGRVDCKNCQALGNIVKALSDAAKTLSN